MSRLTLLLIFLTGCSAAGNDAFDDLRALPEVASVEVSGPADATKLLIHIRDYHYIGRDLYAKDFGGDQGYYAFLDRVDQIQRQQLVVLRHLIRDRGVKAVFAERVTSLNEGVLQERVQNFRRLNTILAEAQKLDGPKAHSLASATQELIDAGREDLLDLGSAGRLLIDGDQVEVLPLDDEKALDEANPKLAGGRFEFDSEKVKAREEAMIKNAFTRGPAAVIILGGAHDLSSRLGVDCRYVRVTVKGYKK